MKRVVRCVRKVWQEEGCIVRCVWQEEGCKVCEKDVAGRGLYSKVCEEKVWQEEGCKVCEEGMAERGLSGV